MIEFGISEHGGRQPGGDAAGRHVRRQGERGEDGRGRPGRQGGRGLQEQPRPHAGREEVRPGAGGRQERGGGVQISGKGFYEKYNFISNLQYRLTILDGKNLMLT